MNLISQWMEARRMRARAASVAADAEFEIRKEKLRVQVLKVRSDLWTSDFKLIKGDYFDGYADCARFYAITPGGKVVRVLVEVNGVVEIQSIAKFK